MFVCLLACLLVYLKEEQLTRQATNLDSCQEERVRKGESPAFKGHQTGSVYHGGQQAATWQRSSLIAGKKMGASKKGDKSQSVLE